LVRNVKEKTIVQSKYRWEDNVKADVRETGFDWIDIAQDRDRWLALVNRVMSLQVTQRR
jgi:hypothetical protein